MSGVSVRGVARELDAHRWPISRHDERVADQRLDERLDAGSEGRDHFS
jgi:hypothetical protein